MMKTLSFGNIAICAALMLAQMFIAVAAPVGAQDKPQVPVVRPKLPLGQSAPPPVTTPASAPSDASGSAPDDAASPNDWAPQLLDAVLGSPNPTAAEALYDAAFAAGPSLIPVLQAALVDDRTAEFAAQELAFLGGEKAMVILQTLISDPRDLDLRRFYLGALGEYRAPEVTQLLLNAVAKSDMEPDRTVTEAAVWALTVRTDASLIPQLRQAESKIQDVVIRDDVDNAAGVIEARARYLATPDGKKAGASIQEAVRTYFIGALETEPSPAPKRLGAATPPQPPPPEARVERVTFFPDETRALSRVTLEAPEASASYDMVLQKQLGEWVVVSVWAGPSAENAEPSTRPKQRESQVTKKPRPAQKLAPTKKTSP